MWWYLYVVMEVERVVLEKVVVAVEVVEEVAVVLIGSVRYVYSSNWSGTVVVFVVVVAVVVEVLVVIVVVLVVKEEIQWW